MTSYVMGFANEFYTLWEVDISEKQTLNGSYPVTHKWFIKNLSKNLDEAKAKLAGTEYRIDLSLRGESTWHKSEPKEQIEYAIDEFPFGLLEGKKIAEATDTWQLTRTYEQDASKRRRVYARRRLIDLGKLVKHDGRYMPADEIEWYEETKRVNSLVSGHFYQNKEKVELSLRLEKQFNFKTMYGTCTLQEFSDEQGRIFKYIGSNSIGHNQIRKGDLVKLTATIKHAVYERKDIEDYEIIESTPETRLLRAKLIDAPEAVMAEIKTVEELLYKMNH